MSSQAYNERVVGASPPQQDLWQAMFESLHLTPSMEMVEPPESPQASPGSGQARNGDAIGDKNGDAVEDKNEDAVEDKNGDVVEDKNGDVIEDQNGDSVEDKNGDAAGDTSDEAGDTSDEARRLQEIENDRAIAEALAGETIEEEEERLYQQRRNERRRNKAASDAAPKGAYRSGSIPELREDYAKHRLDHPAQGARASSLQSRARARNPSPGPPQRPSPGPHRHPSPGPHGHPSPGPHGHPSPGPHGHPSPGPHRHPSPGPHGHPSPDPHGRPSPGPHGHPSLGPHRHPSPGPHRSPSRPRAPARALTRVPSPSPASARPRGASSTIKSAWGAASASGHASLVVGARATTAGARRDERREERDGGRRRPTSQGREGEEDMDAWKKKMDFAVVSTKTRPPRAVYEAGHHPRWDQPESLGGRTSDTTREVEAARASRLESDDWFAERHPRSHVTTPVKPAGELSRGPPTREEHVAYQQPSAVYYGEDGYYNYTSDFDYKGVEYGSAAGVEVRRVHQPEPEGARQRGPRLQRSGPISSVARMPDDGAEHEPTTSSAPHSFSAPNLRPSREVYVHEEAYRPENYSTPSAEYVDTSKDYEIALRMSEGWERLTPLTRSESKKLESEPWSQNLDDSIKSNIQSSFRNSKDGFQPAKAVPHVPRVNEARDGHVTALVDTTPSQMHEDRSRLLERLSFFGLAELEVDGDGACQFRSLSDQLYRNPHYHGFVRECVLHQLKKEHARYEPYVPTSYSNYLHKMKKPTEWGDHVTLQAAADFFGTEINIVTSFKNEQFIVIKPTCEEPSDRVLWLSFFAEVHYNSVYPKSDVPTMEQRAPPAPASRLSRMFARDTRYML